jgi:glycosyltransferase involved in cell wall biosynthesis
VICLARLEAIKQPRLVFQSFVQAARNRSDILLGWVGEGAEKAALETTVRQAGLQPRVFLPGKVGHEDVPAWLAAADIVVLASSSEGLPNSLVEASACARPVVATKVGGIPEVVLDGETGLLVPKGDAVALAAAIGRLLDDPELARRMGEAGRRHVLARFSWKRHADEMMNVYESVRSGRPRQ